MLSSKKTLAVSGMAALALSIAACSSSGTSGGGNKSSSSGAPATTSSSSSSSSAGAGSFKGQSFTVLGQWTGAEQAAFQKVLDAFDKQTGATGTYTPAAGGDEATVLGTKVAGGNPPDVAFLSLPGAIAQYASANKLIPLSPDTQAAVKSNFSSEWGTLGSYQGKAYGVPFDASNKSTVWYATKAFQTAGISSPPKTWADFLKDAQTLSNSGVPVPVSVGGGDGWTLTDWFENVYISQAGLSNYDKLTHHQIPWTDPSVIKALTTLKQLWGNKALIGDPAKAATVPFTGSVDNVFKNGAKSAIVYEGSFVATTIPGDKLPAKVGTDAKFFPFPTTGSTSAMVAGGDFAVAFANKPVVAAFMKYIASPDAGKALVGSADSGFVVPNKNVAASDYGDQVSGQIAAQVVGAGNNFRFDMSDQAPAAFGGTPNKGEWGALQQFLKTGDVNGSAATLEKLAKAQKFS